MIDASSTDSVVEDTDQLLAERLRNYVATAMKRSGYPPLQYMDVDVRDGHIYLTARVPALFMSQHVNHSEDNARPTDDTLSRLGTSRQG